MSFRVIPSGKNLLDLHIRAGFHDPFRSRLASIVSNYSRFVVYLKNSSWESCIYGHIQGTEPILGLSFKPNTDDIRCSSSLRIIDLLLAEDAHVTVYDPAAMDHVKATYLDRLSYAPDVYTCTNQADCVVVATEWNMMRQLDLAKIYAKVRTPFFVDLRNLCSPHELKIAGFDSFVIGNVSEYANQLCKNV